jgi:hypothetical protein
LSHTDNVNILYKYLMYILTDYRQTVIKEWQKTDPTSRQRGRCKITNPKLSKANFKEKEKLVAGPRWVPDTKTDWPTDCRS